MDCVVFWFVGSGRCVFKVDGGIEDQIIHMYAPRLFRRMIRSPLINEVYTRVTSTLRTVQHNRVTPRSFSALGDRHGGRLPVFAPRTAFPNKHHLGSSTIPDNLSVCSISRVPTPHRFFHRRITTQIHRLNVILTRIAPSARKLHLFFIVPPNVKLRRTRH